MIKSIGKITLVTLLAATVLGMPVRVSAQDATKPATPAAPATPPAVKPHPLPFKGKLASVDKVAKTITLDGTTKRVFAVTSETKIMKTGKAATLEDAVVGEEVRGSYLKGDDGKMSLKSLTFGAKPDAALKTASPAKP
ncbi:MAG: hypothetical protein JWR26_4181 [Pedosphaera sp.]|nr:hypothetical protein [Pedosphaera sp.]